MIKYYLETPAGYTTIKGPSSEKDALEYAEQYREETGRVVALKYAPLPTGCMYKVIVKV